MSNNADDKAGWYAEVEELKRRKEMAAQMGGAEKTARQRSFGKLTARERIDALLDPGTFREIGSLAGAGEYNAAGDLVRFTPCNYLFGHGRIDGRQIVVQSDDYTVRGGSAEAGSRPKMVMAERMANEQHLPIVRLLDSSGGSVKTISTRERTTPPGNPLWPWVTANLGVVPVVALGLGSITGNSAIRMVMSHYSVLVKGISHLFIAGPPVVARLGQHVTKDELGSPEAQAAVGAVDDVAATEQEAFELTRRFLSYLPASVHQLPPRITPHDDPQRRDESLISIIPRSRRKVYDVRKIIRAVVDRDSFFEIGKQHGKSIVTGFARLDGWAVALIASDPRSYGGGWTAQSAQKLTRFTDLASTFHLPMVDLVDVPGFVVGVDAERAGALRHGARAVAAMFQSQVPWCTIILRKSFGFGGSAHANFSKLMLRYAWPSADWGSLPLEGGVEAAYRSELAGAADPAARLIEIENELNAVRSPFRTAEHFEIEEIIDPRDTRAILCEFANTAAMLPSVGPVSNAMRP